MNNYYVYAHKFPDGKYYIGLTRQMPQRRWSNGFGYKGQPVYKAIEKYGWDNIEHIIIASELTSKEAMDMEIELIKKYDSIKNGYNNDEGGCIGGNPWCEFEYNGEIYNSNELAELSKYDLTSHIITHRINTHGWSVEDAINTPPGRKNIEFEYNGKFYTIKELFEIRKNKDLTLHQITIRILKHNWDIERAISQPSNKKKQPKGIGSVEIEYNGKKYNTYEICQISPVEDLKPQDVTDRLRRGWSIEKIINTPKKKQNQLFDYNGKKYTSKQLASISPLDNITYHDITDRIRNGWSVEDAITKPKQIRNS